MPSLIHDALVTLFRNRPTLAPELVRDVLHAPLPAFDFVQVGDAALTEVVPTEYRGTWRACARACGATWPCSS